MVKIPQKLSQIIPSIFTPKCSRHCGRQPFSGPVECSGSFGNAFRRGLARTLFDLQQFAGRSRPDFVADGGTVSLPDGVGTIAPGASGRERWGKCCSGICSGFVHRTCAGRLGVILSGLGCGMQLASVLRQDIFGAP